MNSARLYPLTPPPFTPPAMGGGKPRTVVHNPNNVPISPVSHISLTEALSTPTYPVRIPLRDLSIFLVLSDLGHQALQCRTATAYDALLAKIGSLQRCPNTTALLVEAGVILHTHDACLSRTSSQSLGSPRP